MWRRAYLRLVLSGAFVLSASAADAANSSADCSGSTSSTYCTAQTAALRAQTSYLDAERAELQSPLHILSVLGVIGAGIIAFGGVILGFLQLRTTLASANENLRVQNENFHLQQQQLVENQFLEVLKRVSDPSPTTRMLAVPMLADFVDPASAFNIPVRHVAKQLAALLSIEANRPIIDSIEATLLKICRRRDGKGDFIQDAEAVADVRAVFDADYFAARHRDVARALAEFESIHGYAKATVMSEFGLQAADLGRLRATITYRGTFERARQRGYFESDPKTVALMAALTFAARRVATARAVLEFIG